MSENRESWLPKVFLDWLGLYLGSFVWVKMYTIFDCPFCVCHRTSTRAPDLFFFHCLHPKKHICFHNACIANAQRISCAKLTSGAHVFEWDHNQQPTAASFSCSTQRRLSEGGTGVIKDNQGNSHHAISYFCPLNGCALRLSWHSAIISVKRKTQLSLVQRLLFRGHVVEVAQWRT